MSRRRQACNRPTLKLQVDIPRSNMPTETSGLGASGETPLTASFPHFKFLSALENGISPKTPVDRCAPVANGPPEISRMIDARSALVGRWMPTPTEGVLPSGCMEISSSPAEVIPANSGDSEASDSSQSTITLGSQNVQERPSVGKRAQSWLSVRRYDQGSFKFPGSGALSSPFATPFPPTSPL